MSEVKDLHEMDGDSKDVVQEQVTVSPTETEMAILANDAHRWVEPRGCDLFIYWYPGVFECDMSSLLLSLEVCPILNVDVDKCWLVAIGAALFVSIGGPLTKAGPLGLIIGIAIWSASIFAGSNCLIEIATLIPVDGGFVTYANRYVEKSFSMALGWNVRQCYTSCKNNDW